ncbi:hypothetical protein HWV23_11165 [Natronomonas halophila]|uniref:DUF7551 domain-containing protein n=1 Tax=Natronomonas halophila TaxID=2747817 RepID=UPI0015B6FF88|nr:hypothetical protein [Natronomonas halophila]QLD86257.1 hypothetical protein HWV23_11165 [Natronomonas halophila]
MSGSTLADIRRHLESLSDPKGRYYLVCARTGERPFPADGLRFATRKTAAEAADAAAAYRAELRRWDELLPPRDFVVCEDPYLSPSADLVDFCHEVAGAVFETLSTRGYADIENAVIDTYLEAAERVEDRDRLCLLLLECMAQELATLSADEQATVLRAASERLSEPAAALDPISGTLDRFTRLTLIEGYEYRREDDAWQVAVDGYELADGEALPTLPFAVEYFRRNPEGTPAIRAAERDEDGWRFRVVDDASAPDGLVQVGA